jgi:transcriptional regulator with XRE-family HTH domain
VGKAGKLDVPRKPARTQRPLNPKSAFGIVLRRLREKHGDSQDSFAHRTGYHRNYIGQLERGEKSPSLSALFALAEECGMHPSQVLKMVEKLLVSH